MFCMQNMIITTDIAVITIRSNAVTLDIPFGLNFVDISAPRLMLKDFMPHLSPQSR